MGRNNSDDKSAMHGNGGSFWRARQTVEQTCKENADVISNIRLLIIFMLWSVTASWEYSFVFSMHVCITSCIHQPNKQKETPPWATPPLSWALTLYNFQAFCLYFYCSLLYTCCSLEAFEYNILEPIQRDMPGVPELGREEAELYVL
jgi:hypothetical protein